MVSNLNLHKSELHPTVQVTRAADDPVIDTPMVVALDQLQAYDLNPRVTRNPRYDEIKASIRERGLDAPPSITRRPSESCFRIRNGGNTRLSILRELWTETKDSRFFELTCMFRPWSSRGEIVALTGHLAENELRGGLTFIERALGVEKARELYEQEKGCLLSQSALSRCLTADGFPVPQPHISRMREAIDYLLPAIPNLLYGGLGRHQVERLTALRRSLARTWQEHAQGKVLATDFACLFSEALQMFDGMSSEFSIARVQDEIVGQMAICLGIEYETLILTTEAGDRLEQALLATPGQSTPFIMPPKASALVTNATSMSDAGPPATTQATAPEPESHRTADRLQSIQSLIAEHTGEKSTPSSDVLPVFEGSLFPISDIWNIEPGLDSPKRLRIHISQFAREICQDVAKADLIIETSEGIGFRMNLDLTPDYHYSCGVIGLLQLLTTGTSSTSIGMNIGALLLGFPRPSADMGRLSDTNLVRLYRLIRLSRRLLDLGSQESTADSLSPMEAM